MLLAARMICALRRPRALRARSTFRALALALLCASLASLAAAADAGVAALLDAMEVEVAALEAGGADARRLVALSGNAQAALLRATTPSERVRARRVLRRVERMATGQAPLNFSTRLRGHTEPPAAAVPSPRSAGGVVQAQYETPGSPFIAAPPTPSAAPPAIVTPDIGGLSATPPIVANPGAGYVPVVAPRVTRHFVNLEAIGFWVKQDQLPALVTTSPIGTPQATAGVLGEPDTSVLFGNQGVNGDIRPGGRVQGGIWLDPQQTFAVEGHYWGLATETTTFRAKSVFSDGSLDGAILARPFFNVTPGIDAQDAVLVAFPDFFIFPVTFDLDGSIEVKETSRIQSAGGGGRYAMRRFNGPLRVFLLGAYRFFELDESLKITAKSNPGSDPFPIPVPPGHIKVVDSFSTGNTFNGGEVGLAGEITGWRLTLSAESRLALGNMHQTLNIDGRTSAISTIYMASYEGGLLAQPTNIGGYARDRFAYIPSVDVRLGYHVLPSLRLTVGYNFTWISSVLRPGDQVDLSVNTTQIAGGPLVGPANPSATLDDTSIWLQGVTAGMDWRF